jgi:hypothetical protein
MRDDMAMPMYKLIESAEEHHQLKNHEENSQDIPQNDAMVGISDLELDPWNFTSLLMSVGSCRFLGGESKLTYMPTIKPVNTVFRQVIVAVMRFLKICHSLAIGGR